MLEAEAELLAIGKSGNDRKPLELIYLVLLPLFFDIREHLGDDEHSED